MHTGRIFWGMLFATAGVVLLLERGGVMPVEWYSLWRLWPLLLVIWGVSLLAGGKKARWLPAGLAGLLAGIVVAGFLGRAWFHEEMWGDRDAVKQEFVESVTRAPEKASFELDTGAGVFVLADTTDQLFSASTQSTFGTYRVTRDSLPDRQVVRMEFEGQQRRWTFRPVSNRAEIRLSPVPVWEVSIDAGAAKVDCDVSKLKVERLKMNTGATTLKLTLGDRVDDANVDVDAGASAVRIRVPESSWCELRVDAALSNRNFKGFTKVGEGLYQTDNSATARSKIHIALEAGVSSLKVIRY